MRTRFWRLVLWLLILFAATGPRFGFQSDLQEPLSRHFASIQFPERHISFRESTAYKSAGSWGWRVYPRCLKMALISPKLEPLICVQVSEQSVMWSSGVIRRVRERWSEPRGWSLTF